MDWFSIEQSWQKSPRIHWTTAVGAWVVLAVYALSLSNAVQLGDRAVPAFVLAWVCFVALGLSRNVVFGVGVTFEWREHRAILSAFGLAFSAVLWLVLACVDADLLMRVFALGYAVGGIICLAFCKIWPEDRHRLPIYGASWRQNSDIAVLWHALMMVALSGALVCLSAAEAEDAYLLMMVLGAPVLNKFKNCALLLLLWARDEAAG
ncbi:hypothetical protein KUH32_11315 [Thalassococcus sp. CAU 1522]|uniref:Uncharacterized protein n=1 Tax=Thalassococcus arenae TaxID=2851652 RepID=A0ABS6N8M5_9RHOB|nr:hypothetical protein [Thalassococcus arenae]MBV2360368.1 hypothetical protein [Thalassococcus arenae]